MDHHHHQYQHIDHDQYQHQMPINNTIITTIPQRTTPMTMDEEKKMMTTTRLQEPRNCPRCNSNNTKFCYYNNYSLAQPRYLCKSCRRYWTEGGSLRNVPVGGCSRKNKKLQLLLPNSSTSSSTTKNLPDLNPPFVFTTSSNPSKTNENNNDLSLSFSSQLIQESQGHFMEQVGAGGQNSLFPAPVGMIQFHREYDHDHNNKTNLEFSLDRNEKEIGNYGSFGFNGNHDDHHHHHERHDDGNKKREGGSSNELWSGIILGSDSGGPTW